MGSRGPITAELRAACGNANDMVSFAAIESHDFDRLCDAIDAIHANLERENAELRKRLAKLDKRDDSMHDGWVRLPVDADGVPINAGDVLDGYGKTIEVVEMRHGRSGWVLISREGSGYADTFAFTHHHAPTVEDVLREFGIDWEYESDCEDRAALLKEYAKRLRLAEGEDA